MAFILKERDIIERKLKSFLSIAKHAKKITFEEMKTIMYVENFSRMDTFFKESSKKKLDDTKKDTEDKGAKD